MKDIVNIFELSTISLVGEPLLVGTPEQLGDSSYKLPCDYVMLKYIVHIVPG